MDTDTFQPYRLLRNRHLQSVLNSAGPRKWRVSRHLSALAATTEEHILDCGDGVRLQAFHNTPAGAPRGLVVLLHGWEGSANSAYSLSSTRALLAANFAVLRLNFRDHGDTHQLNSGIFHSGRLNEVVGAVKRVAELFPQQSLMIAGISLGGNFALRVAMQASRVGIPLHYAFAVCPVISPAHTLDAMENGNRIYHSYFVRKWVRSLRRKQALYPDRYDFGDMIKQADLRSMTAHLVEHHSPFATLEQYLEGYAIGGDHLAKLKVPATLLVGADDPINPIADFHQLTLNPATELLITPHGGHCGYVENLSFASWAERFMVQRMSERCANLNL